MCWRKEHKCERKEKRDGFRLQMGPQAGTELDMTVVSEEALQCKEMVYENWDDAYDGD